MKIKYQRFAVLASITLLSFGVWQWWFSAPSERQVKRAIEKRLGFSKQAYEILEKLFTYDIDGDPLDVGSLFMDLRDLDEIRNLSAGILMCANTNNDSSVEVISASDNQLAINATFRKNLSIGIGSLVRVEDLSQFTVKKASPEGHEEGSTLSASAKTPWGSFEGSFDWVIPGDLKGRCNFIYKQGAIDYLGIARNNPLSVYDCRHIFKGKWDSYDLADWMVRSYYAVMRFKGEAIPDEPIARVLDEYFRDLGVGNTEWALLSGQKQIFFLESSNSEDFELAVKKLVSNFDVEVLGVATNLKESVSTRVSQTYLEQLSAKYRIEP